MARTAPEYVRPYDLSAKRPIRKAEAAKAIDAIWDEYGRRLKYSWHTEPFTRTKNEGAKYFLRREIYALGLCIYAHESRSWSTADLVAQVRARINRPDKVDDVFHDLLMSIFDDDSQIDRRERWQYAQELQYARRHNVPPELLCGFLLQSGRQSEIRRKLKDGYLEPAFRD